MCKIAPPTEKEIIIASQALTKYAEEELRVTLAEYLGGSASREAIIQALLENDAALLKTLRAKDVQADAVIPPFDHL
ncbi:MAG: hypothetical protein V4438_03375 [Patescibacteria group bacterium]